MHKPKFSKRHHDAIAKVMSNMMQDYPHSTIQFVSVLSKMFKADNPAFDAIEFRKACGAWREL